MGHMDPNDPNDPNAPSIPVDVLIGLAITSHSVGNSVTAFISDVTTTGGVSGGWTVEAIGGVHPPSNDAAMVSLAVIDADGGIVTVEHPDFAATNLTGWNQLDILFSDLAGLDLTAVERIKLGVRMPFAAGTLFADLLHVSGSPTMDAVLAKLEGALGVSADDVVAYIEAEADPSERRIFPGVRVPAVPRLSPY